MFLFGLVIMFQGPVQNYSVYIATRFFLGLFEAGIYPGCRCKETLETRITNCLTNR